MYILRRTKKSVFNPKGERNRGTFFLRHWRGEYNLARSWFVHGALVRLILLVSKRYLPTMLPRGALSSACISSIVTVAMLAMFIWLVVGCWRSAQNHKKLTNRKFWATVAQIVIILAMFGFIVVAYDGFKDGYNLTHTGAKNDQRFKHSIHVLDRGEVVLTGDIVDGVDEELRDVLAKNKNIWLIQLERGGGLLRPAYNIALLIKEHKLTTFTAEECDSACTIAFMAGTHRIINNDAKIGFHKYTYPGYNKQQYMVAVSYDKNYFVNKGVPKKFVDHALSIPHKEIWYPTTNELIKNNIVTHVVFGRELTPVNNTRLLYDKVDRQVLINNFIARYKEITPQLIDAETELREVHKQADTIVFEYYLPNMSVDEVDAKKFETVKAEYIKPAVCGSYEMRSILDKKVNVIERYTGRDGAHVGSATFTQETCKQDKPKSV